jgi:hypothetical protein
MERIQLYETHSIWAAASMFNPKKRTTCVRLDKFSPRLNEQKVKAWH